MPEDLNLVALHRAVNCYHETLLAMANCMGDACPPIGGLYRHRLNRLRARLAFDSSPEALQESCTTVEKELAEYAARTSSYLEDHRIHLRAATSAIQELVRAVSQRQNFYSTRLGQFATQMETAEYPADPDHRKEIVAMQAAGLQSCVASMLQETQSLLARMSDEISGVERRMRESAVSDPVTGMMNRHEMRRQIDAYKVKGITPVLLRFHFTGPLDDEVAKEIAERLGSQLRHKDFVSRWTDTDFLVLFQGPPEVAEARAQQILPWVGGKYLLDSGESVQIVAEVHLAQPELV
jgi:GGDEF domain-containing protein